MLVAVECFHRQGLAASHLLTNQRQLLFRQAEHHSNRFDLGDYHQTCAIAGADLVTDIHLAQTQTTADRRANVTELQVELGLIHRRLIRFQRATVLGNQGCLGVQGLLGNGVLGKQAAIALQIDLRVLQLRLILLQGALRLIQRHAIGARIDLRQQVTGVDFLPLLEQHLDQFTIHPTAHIHRVIGGDRTQGVVMHRQSGFFHRRGADQKIRTGCTTRAFDIGFGSAGFGQVLNQQHQRH